MVFPELLRIVGEEPVFETALLFAGQSDVAAVQRQLTRWTRAGWIVQLRRGLYALAPPYRRQPPHPFVIANKLAQPSYVSGESALAYRDLIPEYVPLTTSVTTRKPARWDTALGSFDFRHVKPEMLFGYERVAVDRDQHAFVATPEKALLDIVHLRAGGDSPDFIESLRLQHTERINLERLSQYAERVNSPKLRRASDAIQSAVARLNRESSQNMEALT